MLARWPIKRLVLSQKGLVSWPFKREGQRLMRLFAGDNIEVLNGPKDVLRPISGGSADLANNPSRIGYFPRNFTVTVTEYQEMKQGGEIDESNESSEQERRREGDDSSMGEQMEDDDDAGSEATEQLLVKDNTEVAHKGPKAHPQFPPLSSKPPVATAFAPMKSKMLKSMPGIPKHHHHHTVADTILEEGESEGGEEEGTSEKGSASRSAVSGASDAGRGGLGMVTRAVSEAERQRHRGFRDESTSEDIARPPLVDLSATAGVGKVTESRISTPATYALGRPERDFVRANMPPEMQSHVFREVKDIADLVLDVAEDSGLAGPADSRGTALAKRALMVAYGESVGDEASTDAAGSAANT
ncbi:hypothetical protein FOZ60_006956 [Perkinsus olseni]|uniref:Uncharacterized protein n=1 Tax=Perkinsus olseni TaxID=32597 RepID=A0A7J6PFM7_PEROL|nr:hypothetical protein FOZ60_006956 [Perkinsus olseni]